jgi:anti-sigma factor RsiW
VISLFVWPAKDGEAISTRSGSGQGYQWTQWKHGGMRFWAVSDAAAEDLGEFARLIQG